MHVSLHDTPWQILQLIIQSPNHSCRWKNVVLNSDRGYSWYNREKNAGPAKANRSLASAVSTTWLVTDSLLNLTPS